MTKKIEKLSAAQTAKLAEYTKRWTEIGLSSAPADRPRAEAAIIEMYRVAGLPVPKVEGLLAAWEGRLGGLPALIRPFSPERHA
jgi:hypothetical protein